MQVQDINITIKQAKALGITLSADELGTPECLRWEKAVIEAAMWWDSEDLDAMQKCQTAIHRANAYAEGREFHPLRDPDAPSYKVYKPRRR